MLTLNQLIEKVNLELASTPRIWSVFGVSKELQAECDGLLNFQDANGIIIYLGQKVEDPLKTNNPSDYLVLIKARRKKTTTKTLRNWSETTVDVFTVCKLELLTPDMGGKTLDEIAELCRNLADDRVSQQEYEAKQAYLKVSAFLEKNGMKLSELTALYQLYMQHARHWDELEKEYGK